MPVEMPVRNPSHDRFKSFSTRNAVPIPTKTGMTPAIPPSATSTQAGCLGQRIKLGGDSWGPSEIEVWSRNSQSVISTAKVSVHVDLPPVLPLISLRIHAEQRKLVLETLGEKRELQVIGEFPDGTVRFISKAAFGTTYQSRNEKIVKVDANGVVTAVGIGETIIVVRNGDKEAQARVIVK